MPKTRKKKQNVQLKYSLLSDEFVSTIGRRRAAGLRQAIDTWTGDKSDTNAGVLVHAYVDSLVAYWSRTKLGDLQEFESDGDLEVTVDLVYKKGRKPNSIRLENNALLTGEVERLLAS